MMKVNCGTDIIEIKRIKESVEKFGENFLNKVFTEQEIEYCESHKKMKYQHYAARFAAKEAISKMFGTGFNGSFDFKDIEVINSDLGKPEVKLYNKALKLYEREGYDNITISISHCNEYAVCFVIGYWQLLNKWYNIFMLKIISIIKSSVQAYNASYR